MSMPSPSSAPPEAPRADEVPDPVPAPVLARPVAAQVAGQMENLAFTVTVAHDHDGAPALAQQVVDTFADLPPSSMPICESLDVHMTSLVRSDGVRLYEARVPGAPAWSFEAPAAIIDHVVTTLTGLVLDHSPDSLHLHAGMIIGDGHPLGSVAPGVLIAGQSGAGKSTLVAEAVAAGWQYATDEMVAVDLESGIARGLGKPLTFKTGTWKLHEGVLGPCPTSGSRWAVRASRLGNVHPTGVADVGLIVFPTFEAGAELDTKYVHPASAVLRLLSDSLDMQRCGRAGFRALMNLVSDARAVEITHSDARALMAGFDGLMTETLAITDGAASQSVEVPATAPDQTADRHKPMRSPAVCSHVLNGRAVLYDETTGLMAELDEGATTWWLAMDGTTTLQDAAGQLAENSTGDVDMIHHVGQQLVSDLIGAGFAL